MTQYTIDIGAVPDDGQGDPLRTAFNFTNLNFDQIFAAGPVLSNVAIANNTIRTVNSNGDLILAPNGIGRIQIKNSLVPSFDNVYELGSPTARFNTIYIGSGGFNVPSITVPGNITANNIIGNTSVISGGNITSAGNITSGGTVSGASLSASSATIYGGIATISLNATGNITTDNYFFGNGAFLTGLVTSVSNISNGNSNISIATSGGNITFGVTGNSNVVVFANTGAYITGVVSATGNITAPNFIGNVVGNISGNITVPGANTQVLFNDSGIADAVSGFTFDKASNLVTVGGNVSAVGFTGNGAGLANVMTDRGGDPSNWNTLTQMGIYAVNRTSWAGTTGTPLDSQVFVGVLEVMNSGNTALSQVFYPGTVGDDVKVQWTRNYWSGVWTAWALMTNDGQVITGGDF
jgi:hypothetical protein